MKNETLKTKTLKGFFWSFSELLSRYGINFIIQILLARLLLPEDFGIIGMITIFIAISQSIIDSGFGNALIREKKNTEEDYSTVFFFNLITAIILYIVLFFSANTISSFFSQPKLTSILRVLSIVLIINSFGLIQRTILTKNIDFKTQTKIVLLSSVISGIVAIGLAYFGFGVWSLVFRNIIMQFLQSFLLCFYNRWKPLFVFNPDSFKRLFGFGWKLLVSGLINTLYKNIYLLIIGKFFSTVDLGYYSNAKKLSEIASSMITSSVQKVSYPVLSSIKDNKDQVLKGYKKILTHTVYISFFVSTILAASAENLIPFLFGEKWVSSVSYFQILCFSSMLFPVHAINLNILKVKGRSDLVLKIAIIKNTISITGIILVLMFKRNIILLLWFNVFISVLSYYINSYNSKILINYSFFEQIKDILPCFFLTVIMGIIVYLIGKIPVSTFPRLILQISLGMSIYFLLSKKFKIQGYQISDIIIEKFKAKR